jgi:hypothetical protein
VVSAAPPDPSGDDRSLLGLELPGTVSRATLTTALAEAGLAQRAILLQRREGRAAADGPALALVTVDGFVADDDPRLAALTRMLRPPVVIGAYAAPIEEDVR